MTAKITLDTLESYLQCKYKCHLKLLGEHGTPSAYEQLMRATRHRLRLAARDALLSQHGERESLCNHAVTVTVLEQSAPLLLDARVEDERLSVRFDALQRAPGPSKLGNFHYIPVLVHEAERPAQPQRTLLELCGVLLGPLQGRMPGYGVLRHGQDGHATKITLHPDDRRLWRWLQEIRDIQGGMPPPLILNRHCQICEFRQRCQEEAVAKDDLSLVRGMGEKEIAKYNRRGIFTVTQLSCTFRPRKRWKALPPKVQPYQAALKALAIRDKKIYVYGTPELPRCPTRIYFDLEGDPDRQFVYLMGMIVQSGAQEERYSFWADTPAGERQLYQQFLDVVRRYEDFQLYAYGSYEAAFLQRMFKHAGLPTPGEHLLTRLVNILSIVYASVYFPTYSNSLKEIGHYLGCSWSSAQASGPQSIVWRRQWEATQSATFKQQLTTYHMEDCLALRKVTEFLHVLCHHRLRAHNAEPPCYDGYPVSHVEALDPPSSRREWGRADFVIPDFAFINNCAYFDYQRNKVYIRANPNLKRSQTRRRRTKGKKNLSVNRCIELSSQLCPFCGGRDVARRQDGRLTRLTRDLRISPSGIRRWVTRFTTTWHFCHGCGKRFLPREYLRLDEYSHTVKSWAMYEHVQHRASLANIADKCRVYFGVPISSPDVYTFKRLLSRYYEETYQRVLENIVGGTLIHADETEVYLRGVGKRYIWVLTNLEEVVFLYKGSREGGFLTELLKDFRGVLVSDFYAPYDALACEQQKCLIHLIRDFNHDVQRHPWDEELKSLAADFGEVLRSIVATIDQHGLRKHYLSKHEQEVNSFFHAVSRQLYRSEVAESYQKRLTKYQHKLFTFLHHDNIPWNNNNAEHALKRFAYYRELSDGLLTEVGLSEYLVLLSICVTCKYKEVDFLQFLVSREKDIDVFLQSGCQRRSPPAVELLPDGFVFSRRKRRPPDWDQGHRRLEKGKGTKIQHEG